MMKARIRAAITLHLDRRAVTAIEYALIASLASITIAAALTRIGDNLTVIFNKVSTAL